MPGGPYRVGRPEHNSGDPHTRIITRDDRLHILSGPHGAMVESPRAARPPTCGPRNTREGQVRPETQLGPAEQRERDWGLTLTY